MSSSLHWIYLSMQSPLDLKWNLNALIVAFIEILGNCPCLFYRFANTTLKHLGFGISILETAVFDCICWFVLVVTDSSLFIQLNVVWNRQKNYSEGKIHKSEPEPRNGKLHAKEKKWPALFIKLHVGCLLKSVI